MIQRDNYLQKVISADGNGLVKIITGGRRTGKSYLLFKIFYSHLLRSGILPEQTIKISFKERKNIPLLNPDSLL